MFSLVLLSGLANCAVPSLDDNSFFNFVNQPGASVIKFYMTDCRHCVELAPTFYKLSELFDGIDGLRFAECNIDDAPQAQEHFGIEYLPEVLWITPLSSQPLKYDGDKSLNSLVDFVNMGAENIQF
ncbi:hypothetical protein BLNAU_16511 [Blattamonas nauphoetae]|uniref:Thioredoxin domain-containing protein n=1 Tax=Blattamonas nauphoetae TaxID=2049346 RepID=A0ABQ9XBB1_9EUKA|nr:hypothetical protein BLNAU_16511 [Blattamonas nauphoetae]